MKIKRMKFDVFTRPIEVIFRFMFAFPVIVLFLYLLKIKKIDSFIPEDTDYSILLLVLVVFVLLFFLYYKSLAFLKWTKKLILQTKSYLYSKIVNSDIPWFLARLIIRTKPLNLFIENPSQEKFINEFIIEITQRNTNQRMFYYLGGASGSGKSSTILELIEKIFVHKKLFHLSNKIFYVDFCVSTEYAQSIIDILNSGETKEYILIIDNYHFLGGNLLKKLNSAITKKSNQSGKEIIIISSQTLSPNNTNEGFNVINFAKKNNRYYKVSLPTATSIKKYCQDFEKQDLLEVIHILQMQHSSNKKNKSHKELLTNLSNKNNTNPNIERVIAVIVALSIHRGYFSNDELKSAFKSICKAQGSLAFFNYLILVYNFHKLEKIGFIQQSIISKESYFFHDRLAKIYKKNEKHKSRFFINTFNQVIQLRFLEEYHKNNFLLAWLYQLEAEFNTSHAINLFSKAQLSGSITVMLSNLERAYEEKLPYIVNNGKLFEEAFRELALLYELNGNFEQSNRYYQKALTVADNEKEKASIELEILEFSHGRIETSFAEIQATIDKLTSAVKEYQHGLISVGFRFWLVHMKIHMGKFDREGMYKIMEFIEQNFISLFDTEPYKTVHLLRRCFFDVWRLCYLEGENNDQYFKQLFETRSSYLLQEHEPHFKAYYKKHISAQYIHYKIIYEYAIYKVSPDKNILKSLEIDVANYDIDSLINKSESEYQDAYSIFNSDGNKSDRSTFIRLSEIELMKKACSIEKIEEYISLYKQYIADKNIPDFFGNVYSLESKVKLNEYIKHKQIAGANDFSQKKLKVLFHEIINTLDKAEVYYSENRNKYGQVRVQFFKHISNFIECWNVNQFKSNLKNLHSQAKQCNYHREVKLINLILESEEVSINSIVNIIKYYPVVIQ